jgi:hypothetical protein
MNNAHNNLGQPQHDPDSRPRSRDEPVILFQHGQLITKASGPVPRAELSAFAAAALWALRVFAVLVSLMVIYTFIGHVR